MTIPTLPYLTQDHFNPSHHGT